MQWAEKMRKVNLNLENYRFQSLNGISNKPETEQSARSESTLTGELISTRRTPHKHNKKDPSHLR